MGARTTDHRLLPQLELARRRRADDLEEAPRTVVPAEEHPSAARSVEGGEAGVDILISAPQKGWSGPACAGLVMLGGYNSLGPGGYAGTELGELLPVRLGGRDIGQMTDPFLPVLSPEGARHPIFANIAGFFPTGRAQAKESGLPPLDGCTRVEGPKPTATAIPQRIAT